MNADSAIDLSIVIPVYRSAAVLRTLAGRLMRALESAALRYEIIFVEDGSPDESWEVLSHLHAEHPDLVTALQLTRNFGQHNALMCGFRHARGRYVLTMDDDLQHPPEEIPKLLAAIEAAGDDVVYGVPESRRHHRWRNVGSALVTTFYRVVFRTKVQPSAFRIIRRELIDAILDYSLNYTFVDGLLAWHTQRIGQVTVQHQPRAAGRSGYSLGKLLLLAMNLFTNFSLIPLQLVSLTGLLAALGGFAGGAYFLALYFLARIEVPGYASMIVAILVLGGVQLLALGIMGEYLGRLHLNVNRKPQYSIRSVLAAEGEERPGAFESGHAAEPVPTKAVLEDDDS